VYSREEPDAGKPHVRICEGESRMAELLDQLESRKQNDTHDIIQLLKIIGWYPTSPMPFIGRDFFSCHKYKIMIDYI